MKTMLKQNELSNHKHKKLKMLLNYEQQKQL